MSSFTYSDLKELPYKVPSLDIENFEYEGDGIRVLDLFSGVGGLGYGLEMCSNQFKIVAAVDHSEAAIESLNKNHKKDIGFVGDLSEFGPEDLETSAAHRDIHLRDTIDVIVGGPPCKGFSDIRPHKSQPGDDDRNYLYQFYFDYVQNFKPKVFLMENVPSLLVHKNDDGVRIFENILERAEGKKSNTEDDVSYDIKFCLLNAAQFGVPQSRTRLFLVGVREDVEINFPKPQFRLPADERFNVHFRNYLDTTNETVTLDEFENDNERTEECLRSPRPIEVVFKDLMPLAPGESSEEYFVDLSWFNREDYNPDMEEFEDEDTVEYLQYLRQDEPDDLTWHVSSDNTAMMKKRIAHAGTTREELPEFIFPSSGYNSTYSRVYKNVTAPTLTTTFTSASSTRCIHPYENRALSVREGARIQSFPDHIDFVGSKTDVTTQIGNAVPPLLARAVGFTILDAIKQMKS